MDQLEEADGYLLDLVGSDQRDELALGIRVPFDITLCGIDGLVSGQQLYVAETASGTADIAGRSCDEGAAARVPRSLAERMYGNITRWTRMERGADIFL